MDKFEKIPQKKSVALLVLLNIITAGLYTYIWYILRSKELNNLKTKAKLKKIIPVVSLILFIITYITLIAIQAIILITGNPVDFSSPPIEFMIIAILVVSLALIWLIMVLFMAFRTRKILNQSLINKGEKVKLSWFYTLIFNFLYLQYEINRIVDDKENNKRKGPLIWFIILYILPSIIMIIGIILIIAGIEFIGIQNYI